MNDNTTIKHDWLGLIYEEWGFHPVSCKPDADNHTVVAIFNTPLRISGEMRIKGYTIIPQTLTHSAEHPFNAGRNHRGGRPHRVLLQNKL